MKIDIQGLKNYNPSLTKDLNPYPGLPAVLSAQSFSDIRDISYSGQLSCQFSLKHTLSGILLIH